MPKITFTLNGKPTTVSYEPGMHFLEVLREQDRKSTRLNSSHLVISYAVFCLKKKNPPRQVLLTAFTPERGVPLMVGNRPIAAANHRYCSAENFMMYSTLTSTWSLSYPCNSDSVQDTQLYSKLIIVQTQIL